MTIYQVTIRNYIELVIEKSQTINENCIESVIEKSQVTNEN